MKKIHTDFLNRPIQPVIYLVLESGQWTRNNLTIQSVMIHEHKRNHPTKLGFRAVYIPLIHGES